MTTTKGFIKLGDKIILPITRGELVLDSSGNIALQSTEFLAGGVNFEHNLPGLITAAERRLLATDPSINNASLGDVYTKLNYINSGLKINNVVKKFYDANGNSTPINILTGGGLVATGDGNSITISLGTLAEKTVASSIIRGITTDIYGRVTSITGESLTNSDIPNTLSGKTLSGCSVAETPTEDTHIASKGYVDSVFETITGIASGGLKFSGSLDDAGVAASILQDPTKLNSYYKVTGSFTLSTELLYDTRGIVGTSVTVKTGDTLIVYKKGENTLCFVYIPSADDKTLINVKGFNNGVTSTAINGLDGNIYLNFSQVFNVTGSNGSANIVLPQATSSTSGYLSYTDYIRFDSYASKDVSYTANVSESATSYKIGSISIGSATHNIYGKDYSASISLLNSSENVTVNPILRFTQAINNLTTDIALKGSTGIVVNKNGDSVEFSVNNVVDDSSKDYLTINGNSFGVKLGSVNDDNTINDGLVSFNTLNTFAQNTHRVFTIFEEIANSLTDTTKTLYYGSDALKAAVNITNL